MGQVISIQRGNNYRARWQIKNRSYLAGSPVRLITGKKPKRAVGLLASTKMCGYIPWESQLERDFYRVLEVDSNVAGYAVQPESIFFNLFGERHRYTPDVLVTYADAEKHVVEVKPKKFADLEANQLGFRAIGKVYAARGITFRVVTEVEIRHQNMIPLITEHMRWRDYAPSPALEAFVSELFRRSPPETLGDLERLVGHPPEDRYKLIAMATWGAFSMSFNQNITAETLVYPSPIDPFQKLAQGERYSTRRREAA